MAIPLVKLLSCSIETHTCYYSTENSENMRGTATIIKTDTDLKQ